jgi:hypothetical protein
MEDLRSFLLSQKAKSSIPAVERSGEEIEEKQSSPNIKYSDPD